MGLFFFFLSFFAFSSFADSYSSFVAPPNRHKAVHGASFAALSNGELFSCYFAGTKEGSRDAQIFCARSKDLGRTWDDPTVAVTSGESVVDAWFANKTVGNTVLYEDEERNLWLFYTAVVWGGWSGSHVDYKVSKDLGATWSPSRRLIGNFGNLPRNKPLRLDRNRFLLPLYHEFTSFQGYSCDITVANAKVIRKYCADIPSSDHGQPALFRKDADTVNAYLRSKKSKRVTFSQYSFRSGKWTSPSLLALPNPDSALDVIETPAHEVLMLYNSSPSGRNPLSLALSKDGVNFTWIKDVENQPGTTFSYPVIEREGARYFLVYTYDERTSIRFQTFLDSDLSRP